MSQASEKCALETGRTLDLSLISNSIFLFQEKRKICTTDRKVRVFLKTFVFTQGQVMSGLESCVFERTQLDRCTQKNRQRLCASVLRLQGLKINFTHSLNSK